MRLGKKLLGAATDELRVAGGRGAEEQEPSGGGGVDEERNRRVEHADSHVPQRRGDPERAYGRDRAGSDGRSVRARDGDVDGREDQAASKRTAAPAARFDARDRLGGREPQAQDVEEMREQDVPGEVI